MSVPNEPIVPPPPLPIDTLPQHPGRIPGDEPPRDPEPDEPTNPMIQTSSHCPTWSLVCRGVRSEPEKRH